MTELFRGVVDRQGGHVGQVPVISGARLDLATGLALTMPCSGSRFRDPLWSLALTVSLVIFASLGLGFAISGLAKTDSQAVQYSMVVLLLSIFFTGFVLLDKLTVPVRCVVSGARHLRDQRAPERDLSGTTRRARSHRGPRDLWPGDGGARLVAVRKDVEPASAPAVKSVSHQLLEVGAKLLPCSADILADLDLVQLLLELIQTRLYLLPGDDPSSRTDRRTQ